MPPVHGSKAVFKVQNSAGVITDVSTYLRRAGLPLELDTEDASTLGMTGKQYVAGLSDANIPLEGPWSPEADGFFFLILGATKNFEYYPMGTTAGNPKYTGSCIIGSWSIDTPVTGAGTFSCAAQVTGNVTRALAP